MAARSKRLIVVALLLAITGGLKASGYDLLGYDLLGYDLRGYDLRGLHVPVAGDLQVSGNRQVSGPPARRIVSLVPSVTEMLFAVGAAPQMVGVSSYDDFPPEARKLPRVGALLDPNVERILSLKPDLVITYVSQTELEGQLKRAGIRVFSDRHGGIATILQTLRDVGLATGHAAEADRQAREIQSRLDAIRARVSGRPRPRTLMVFGRQPGTLQQLYAVGGLGFLHEMLELAGGDNLFTNIKRESVQPSHETLIARAPEVVLQLQAGRMLRTGEAEDARKTWSALASIPAVRNRRVLALNGDYLVVPGPRIAAAVEAFARALHPDAFR